MPGARPLHGDFGQHRNERARRAGHFPVSLHRQGGAQLARTLGIDHAGFDVAWVDGHPYLLEFNALFGNEALNRLGIRVEEAIVRYLEAHDTPFTPHTPMHPSTPVPRAS
ncbi:ATP-grasp domain-containing protein [Calditerricola satsumensis]|uniref:hypothetical protein n=1 Tax=Calditerricola satsumensis TaxID=373054 RepID=UPI0027E5BBED|nr:hypothetical protein [Calditerricola satsumensis]